MNAAATIDAILKKYGDEITVCANGKPSFSVRGLIRPLNFKRLPNSNELGVSWDASDDSAFLYYGSPEYRFDKELQLVSLLFDGQRFLFTRAGVAFLQRQPLYVWAVLQKAL